MTGPIAPELGSIRDLVTLDLRGNSLSGQIPEELGGFRQLQRLYLGGNKFTGCIPASWRLVEDHDLATLGLPFLPNQDHRSPAGPLRRHGWR